MIVNEDLSDIKVVGSYEGYKFEEFEFMGQKATVIFPKKLVAGNKWLFKTEYLGAFPTFEEEMLEKGYAVAHVDNYTRWRVESDTERQNAFCELLAQKYNFNKKCVPVGMSCGGMQAIYLASKHPDKIACLYLDAPVVNFLSCPCHLVSGTRSVGYEEYVKYAGMTDKDLLSFRNQPLDNLHYLVENKIPTILVCGDSDTTVPYDENGINITKIYENSGVPFELYIKENCDHHPHGFKNNKPLFDFIEKYYK